MATAATELMKDSKGGRGVSEITVRVPGKLFLAGEYAVVHSGHYALVMAINRYISVRITPASVGSVCAADVVPYAVHWSWQGNQICWAQQEPALQFVMEAMALFYRWQPQLANGAPYRVHITSDLVDSDQRKYGFGSSGAVVVAVLRAVAQLHGCSLNADQAFKLAVLCQQKLAQQGSGGDVAAAACGGCILYRRYDAQWLRMQLAQQRPIDELIATEWPLLALTQAVTRLPYPVLVGWTRQPASTEGVLRRVLPTTAEEVLFAQQSSTIVLQLVAALQRGDAVGIFQAVAQNRQLLLAYQQRHGITIETDLLKTLCAIATAQQAAAKTSGAGGGDCGYAIDLAGTKEAIEAAWQQAGITPLAVQMAPLC